MPTPADRLPPGVNGLALKIQALEREVRELRAARRLESASISSGRFSVITPGGTTVFGIGKLPSGLYGTELRRDDGSLAVSVSGQDAGTADTVRVLSRSGQTLITDDEYADGFLGRPWVPVPMTPAVAVTAGSWVTTHIGVWLVQHRVLDLRASVVAPAATTGQVRIRALWEGAYIQLGPTITATDGETFLDYRATGTDLAGIEYGDRVVITQECQRTAGAGTVNSWSHGTWGSNTYDSGEA